MQERRAWELLWEHLDGKQRKEIMETAWFAAKGRVYWWLLRPGGTSFALVRPGGRPELLGRNERQRLGVPWGDARIRERVDLELCLEPTRSDTPLWDYVLALKLAVEHEENWVLELGVPQ
jgi:hypothetical protein